MGIHYYGPGGKEQTPQEFMAYLDSFRAPIYDEMMKSRCTNCLLLFDDCRCCNGCAERDSDIIGHHGYGCVL